MKKNRLCILLSCSLLCLSACTANQSTSTTTSVSETTIAEKKSDADFIVGVGKGLEKRWELAGKGDAMSDEEFDKLTLSEYKELYKSYVDAELNEIGNLDGYQFKNSDLNDLANDYMNCLQLQKNSVDSFTEKSTNNSPEWNYGYQKRIVDLSELFNNYGLTVSETYTDTKNEMTDTNLPYAKKYVAIIDWLTNLNETINFEEVSNDSSWKEYKALVENTTDYDIAYITINIDLLDESGVTVEQQTCYLNNLTPGGKYYATFSSDKAFTSMKVTPRVNFQ